MRIDVITIFPEMFMPGMVMTPQPIYDAVRKIKGRRKAKVVLLCPTGKPLKQKLAKKFAKERNLILICGHYEGVDARLYDLVIDERLSIGDYVLTGGEIPAMVGFVLPLGWI